MTRTPPTNYAPQSMKDRLASDEYHALLFRNPETEAKENMMDDFMSFVEDEFELSNDEKNDLQELVNAFIGYDSKKVKQGEKAMLDRWIKSVNG